MAGHRGPPTDRQLLSTMSHTHEESGKVWPVWMQHKTRSHSQLCITKGVSTWHSPLLLPWVTSYLGEMTASTITFLFVYHRKVRPSSHFKRLEVIWDHPRMERQGKTFWRGIASQWACLLDVSVGVLNPSQSVHVQAWQGSSRASWQYSRLPVFEET